MVQDVRSSATGVAFDLLSQEGVMSALAFVRQSSASVVEKRELRDLIFNYSNMGGDPALRTLILDRLTSLTIVKTTPDVSANQAINASHTTHVAPVTTAPSSSIFTPHIVEESVIPNQALDQTAKVSPLGHSRLTPVFEPPISVKTVTRAQSNIPPITTPAMPESVMANTVVPPVPVEATVAVTTETSMPTVSPSQASDDAVAAVRTTQLDSDALNAGRARIAEIKKIINAKVGNPINLLDLDAALGREYMSALLESMKISSGGDGDLASALSRLETVFTTIMSLADGLKAKVDNSTHQAKVAAPDNLEHRESETIRMVNPDLPIVAIPHKAPPAIAENIVSATMPEANNSADLETSVAAFSQSDQMTKPLEANQVAKIKPTIPELSALTQNLAPQSVPASSVRPVEVSSPVASVPNVKPAATSIPATPSTDIQISPMDIATNRDGIRPVSAAWPLRTPDDLPSLQDVKNASGITDPLHDSDVDAGLEQLLSEWSLFKKSGVFGSGPRGTKHPLFERLASLQMPVVIAGRFEGSTPEIRQSITDYMNGWRYEQGILYENDETFEHYLRRVIRHILDLQMKRSGA